MEGSPPGGRIQAKPDIPLLKEKNTRAGFLEIEQLHAVMQHLADELRPVVAWPSPRRATGVRRGGTARPHKVSPADTPPSWARSPQQADAREARRRVAEIERLSRSTFVPAFELGLMRVALGDIDLAFDWLRRSCDMREPRLTGIGFQRGVDPIREDPGASPSSWRASGCRSTRRAPADPSVRAIRRLRSPASSAWTRIRRTEATRQPV